MAGKAIPSPTDQAGAVKRTVRLTINGREMTREVEPRLLLSDFLRHEAGLTGTHVGCEHGVCGACTILLDGRPVRSCLLLAVQADGASITTVEGLAQEGRLHPLQEAFREHHALQCGFCTPGFLMTVAGYTMHDPLPDTDEGLRRLLSGNLCRCTGYENIIQAVRAAYQGAQGKAEPAANNGRAPSNGSAPSNGAAHTKGHHSRRGHDTP